MNKIRVLVVDESAAMRKLVSEVVDCDPGMETAGVAANGRIALQRMTQVSPDVITLNMEIREMGGIELLRELRRTYAKIPVIILRSHSANGAAAVLEALRAGASDYVATPFAIKGATAARQLLTAELLPRIRRFFPKNRGLAKSGSERKRVAASEVEVVAVAASTGGPNALVQLFSQFSEPLSVPVVIVQHMPPVFTKTLAERLNDSSTWSVQEGVEGQVLRAGHAYIAPGGKHMETRRRGSDVVLHLHEGPLENSCRPAADVLFRSVAECYGASALAVVLTGMGRDGFLGTEAICQGGGVALAQDEASSVVWGMPRILAEEGLAEGVLPLGKMASAISARVRGSSDAELA